MDRIVIHGSPVSFMQQIYVYKDKKIIDEAEASFDSLPNVVTAFIKKYNIKTIDLTGVHSFVKEIENRLTSMKPSDFNFLEEIHFRYL